MRETANVRQTLLVAVVALCAQVGLSTVAPAQRPAVPDGTDMPPDIVEQDAWTALGQAIRDRIVSPLTRTTGEVTVESSPEAQHLLKRVANAVDQGDWKVALDAFDRITDQFGGELLTLDENHYLSARRTVLELLAQLPPDGLATYRLLHDGEARTLFNQAASAHDFAALRTVVNRYFLTSVGDDAADLLATWLLDEGRYAEALPLLEDIERLHPDPDVSPDVLHAKLALANALIGSITPTETALSKANSLAPEKRDAIMSLAEFRLESRDGERVDELAPWTALMGKAASRGRMPEVTPTLRYVPEWQARPGFLNPDPSYPRDPLLRAEPVSAGRFIIVNAGLQLVAFDVETMDRAWETTPPLQPRWAQAQPGAWLQQICLVTSVADGLVFHIDLVGTGVYTGGDVLDGHNENDDDDEMNAYVPAGTPAGNRLVAYDLSTGLPIWSRGRTIASEDPLERVRFRGPPVAMGDNVLALYERRNELWIGRLDGADGRLLDERALCGLPMDRLEPGAALMMSASDGMVFVPTRRGVLLAVDGYDLSLKWACRYGREPQPVRRSRWDPGQNEGAPLDNWLMSPPIVTDAVVLYPSDDADKLIAVDRWNGRQRWSRARETLRYVLGADDKRCWVVGDRVMALDLMTGQSLWTQSIDDVSGRGCVSGDRLLVPTQTSLVMIDALSGGLIETLELPPGQPSLGNLLCRAGALFSVDGQFIRKFPDLGGGYDTAKLALERSPADVSLAIRLAWLELLQDRPAAALEVLDTVPPNTIADVARTVHADRLRVRALLAMAQQDDTDADKLLNRAESLASDAESRAQVALSMLRLDVQRGALLDAYQRGLELARSRTENSEVPWDESLMITSDAKGSKRHVVDLVRDELAKVNDQLDDEKRTELETALKDELQFALDLRDYSAAELFADLNLPFGVGDKAAVQLGTWELQDERYEVAAHLLADEAATTDDPEIAVEAANRLGEILTEPLLNLPIDANAVAERVKTLAPDADAPSWTQRIDNDQLNERRQRRAHEAVQIPDRLRTLLDFGPLHRVKLTGRPSEWMDEHMLAVTQDGRILCLDLETGEPAWEAPTSLNRWGRNDSEGELQPQRRIRGGRTEIPLPPLPYRAHADDLIIVVHTEDGLLGLAAATGRAVWYRPVDDGLSATDRERLRVVGFGDDHVALTPEPGLLEVLDLATGRARWRRPIRATSASELRFDGNKLLAIDDAAERVQVFDADTGAHAGELTFDQRGDGIALVSFDATLCGPIGKTIVAYDTASLSPRWEIEPASPVQKLVRASDNVLAAVSHGGAIRYLDAADGHVKLEIAPEQVGEEYLDTSVAEGVACIAGRSRRGDLVMAAYALENGHLLWGPDDPSKGSAMLTPGWMTSSPSTITLFARQKNRFLLRLLDRRTGRRVCPDIQFNAPDDPGEGPTLQWWPGNFVLSNGQDWWVYSAAAPSGESG